MKKSDQIKILNYVSKNSQMNFLEDRYLIREKDMITFASLIFNLETLHRMGVKLRIVKIPISSSTAFHCDLEQIKQKTEELLLYVLLDEIEVRFEIVENGEKFKRDKSLNFDKQDAICLFSGGIDSFSGINLSSKQFGDVLGVSIIHSDQPKGANVVDTLSKDFLISEHIKIRKVIAPPMKRFGYSQLRGFLYCIYGSIFLRLCESKNLLITEIGPTMYQNRFSPFDSVTMTTHPYVLGKCKSIIELFLKEKINFITPFENLTKAEVMVVNSEVTDFSKTHSCISLGTGVNCGKCYGCVIRYIGGVVAGIKDANYKYYPMVKDYDKSENMISLFRFAFDILLNYTEMDFSSKENIYLYKKQRLFRRFALECFASVYVLQKEGKDVHPTAIKFYTEVLKKYPVDLLKERLSDVRKKRFKPNFKKYVKGL